MEEEFPQIEEQNDLLNFDKRSFLLALKKKIPALLLIPFIVTVVAGAILKFSVPKVWRVKSVLLYQEKNINKKSQVPYLYQNFNFETILHSIAVRRNLEQVRKNLDLDVPIQQMYSMIDVERGRESNFINILVTGEDPDKLVKIANNLGEVFIKNYSSMLNKSVYEMLDYYQRKQKEYKNELEETRDKIKTFNSNHNLASVDTEIENKYKQINNLEVKILDWQIKINTLKTIIRDIESQLTKIPEKERLSYSIKSSDRKKLEQLKQELEVLRKQYTDKNPKVQKKLNQYETLKEQVAGKSDTDFVADEIVFGKSPLRNDLELELKQYQYKLNSDQKALKDYKTSLKKLKNELDSLNVLQNPYNDLKRKEDLASRGLDLIENRIMESRLAIESNVDDFEIIEKAIKPDYSIGVSKKLILAVIGFFVFIGTVVFFAGKEFFDDSIKSRFDLEEILDLKFLGEVPNKDSINSNTYFSQVQILYGQLKKQMAKNNSRIITFGSMQKRTGKSFVIYELTDMLPAEDKNILWIDSTYNPEDDIEKYIINRELYSDSQSETIEAYNFDNRIDKLYFHINENTIKSILKEERLQNFLNKLQEYDYIFWELFKSSDNMQLFTTLAEASDLLVLLARFDVSSRNVIKNALEFLETNSNVPICGVLNDIPEPFFKVKF